MLRLLWLDLFWEPLAPAWLRLESVVVSEGNGGEGTVRADPYAYFSAGDLIRYVVSHAPTVRQSEDMDDWYVCGLCGQENHHLECVYLGCVKWVERNPEKKDG